MTMKKPLEVWHLIISIAVLILTVGAFIVNQSNEIQEQKVKINYLESQQRDFIIQFRDNNQQFKEIDKKLTDILVLLQNKKDK